ncbi:hypothetical protein AUP42_01715 [Thalassospira lucentensis]|uniref:Uncharacterized protein n=1 Tax=Thalassospira lucentensis TaxID=168935 RepID=A0A154L3L0_9PROT|nr:hypothetical protein [Thalassospira lucentensis]KZB63135.1 hypothetical protein AUP42_01715 [Thalassospira lucentensis]
MLWEKISIFAFGVVFISVLLAVALFLPEPTDFQYTIIRIILALSAAGIAALIPGFIEIKYKNICRAGGAMAVFLIVYFKSPASIVTNVQLSPTDPFKILVVRNSPQLQIDTFTFPISDIEKRSTPKEFFAILSQLPAPSIDLENSKVFRVRDEKLITESTGGPLESNNDGILIVPKAVLQEFESDHLAFTFLFNETHK